MNGRDPTRKVRVLFLTANPPDTSRLAVGEEYREIVTRLVAAGGRIEAVYAPEVRVAELAQVIQCHRPDVVHFSGHATEGGELLLPDAEGRAAPAKPEAVAELLGLLSRDIAIRCVLLNACYSNALAGSLAAHVECVIGVPAALRDGAAVAFACAFYEALAYGRDLDTAYRLACVQVGLAVPARGELPTLHCRPGVDARAVRLLPPPIAAVTPTLSERPLGGGRSPRARRRSALGGLAAAIGAAALLLGVRAPNRDRSAGARKSGATGCSLRDPEVRPAIPMNAVAEQPPGDCAALQIDAVFVAWSAYGASLDVRIRNTRPEAVSVTLARVVAVGRRNVAGHLDPSAEYGERRCTRTIIDGELEVVVSHALQANEVDRFIINLGLCPAAEMDGVVYRLDLTYNRSCSAVSSEFMIQRPQPDPPPTR